MDLEAAEEWEGPANGFGKQLDLRPIVVKEIEFPELLRTGANQCQDVGTAQASRGDIKRGALRALEPSFHELAGPFNAQV